MQCLPSPAPTGPEEGWASQFERAVLGVKCFTTISYAEAQTIRNQLTAFVKFQTAARYRSILGVLRHCALVALRPSPTHLTIAHPLLVAVANAVNFPFAALDVARAPVLDVDLKAAGVTSHDYCHYYFECGLLHARYRDFAAAAKAFGNVAELSPHRDGTSKWWVPSTGALVAISAYGLCEVPTAQVLHEVTEGSFTPFLDLRAALGRGGDWAVAALAAHRSSFGLALPLATALVADVGPQEVLRLAEVYRTLPLARLTTAPGCPADVRGCRALVQTLAAEGRIAATVDDADFVRFELTAIATRDDLEAAIDTATSLSDRLVTSRLGVEASQGFARSTPEYRSALAALERRQTGRSHVAWAH